MARFSNLRTLKLFVFEKSELNDNHLTKWQFDELTELDLYGGFGISIKGIIQIITKHRKLHTITLRKTQFSIGHDEYEKIAEICRKQNRKLTMKWKVSKKDENGMVGINYDPNFTIEKFKKWFYKLIE